MDFVESSIYKNGNGEIESIKVKRFKKEEKVSDYTMKVGSRLVVNQLNTRAKKNRGRVVEVTGFPERANDDDRKVKVKYLDTNRSGKVEVGDLDTLN